jgi:hypothetical protein
MTSKLLLIGVVIVIASLSAGASSPVRLYDTKGNLDETNWTVLTGTPTAVDPQHLVLENGNIRITYPCRKGVPGKDGEYFDNKAGHVLHLRRDGAYQLAQDAAFGDWTYVGGSFADDPTNCSVLQNSEEVVEIVLDFPNHKDLNGHPNGCRKHVILHRGHYGYIVRIEEEDTIEGEREAGFGNAASPDRDVPDSRHFFTYSTKAAYLWSPDDPVPGGSVSHYEFLRDLDGPSDWWGVGVAFRDSYYRFVGLKPQTPQSPTIRSGSFPHGYLAGLIRYRSESMATTGYEVYIAAVPYDGSNAGKATVEGESLTVNVPRAGHYTIFSEGVTDPGGSKHYERAIKDIELTPGAHAIGIRGTTLKNPIVVPLANGRDFPEDIWKAYLLLYRKP